MDEKDLQDMRLARPVSITDLWDIDDRISRLEEICERMEKMIARLVNLYYQERVKTWALILDEMVKERDRKNGDKTSRMGADQCR